jgi:hypothetical protein
MVMDKVTVIASAAVRPSRRGNEDFHPPIIDRNADADDQDHQHNDAEGTDELFGAGGESGGLVPDAHAKGNRKQDKRDHHADGAQDGKGDAGIAIVKTFDREIRKERQRCDRNEAADGAERDRQRQIPPREVGKQAGRGADRAGCDDDKADRDFRRQAHEHGKRQPHHRKEKKRGHNAPDQRLRPQGHPLKVRRCERHANAGHDDEHGDRQTDVDKGGLLHPASLSARCCRSRSSSQHCAIVPPECNRPFGAQSCGDIAPTDPAPRRAAFIRAKAWAEADPRIQHQRNRYSPAAVTRPRGWP